MRFGFCISQKTRKKASKQGASSIQRHRGSGGWVQGKARQGKEPDQGLSGADSICLTNPDVEFSHICTEGVPCNLLPTLHHSHPKKEDQVPSQFSIIMSSSHAYICEKSQKFNHSFIYTSSPLPPHPPPHSNFTPNRLPQKPLPSLQPPQFLFGRQNKIKP